MLLLKAHIYAISMYVRKNKYRYNNYRDTNTARRGIAAVAILGTLAAGVGGVHLATADHGKPKPNASAADHKAATPPPIDARAALKYKELPPAVQRVAGAAVAITVPFGKDTVRVNRKNEVVSMEPAPEAQGSGVVIKLPSKGRAVLTAAHVSQPSGCGDLDVLSQNSAGNPGLVLHVAHKSVDDRPPQDPYTKKYNADAVLLKPELNDVIVGDFEHMPALTVPKEVNVKPGDVGFAINFEPTQDSKMRNPLEPGVWANPAELSSVAITPVREDGTFLALAGVGRSYGATEEKHIRGGASGGALFSPDGKLLGLTIASDAMYTARELKDQYNVNIPHSSQGRVYDTVVVQPITQNLVNEMLGEANSSPVCEPTPPIIKHVP